MRKTLFVLCLCLFVSIAKADQRFSNEYCEEAVRKSEWYLDLHSKDAEDSRQLSDKGMPNAAAEEARKANAWLAIAANWASIYDAFCKE